MVRGESPFVIVSHFHTNTENNTLCTNIILVEYGQRCTDRHQIKAKSVYCFQSNSSSYRAVFVAVYFHCLFHYVMIVSMNTTLKNVIYFSMHTGIYILHVVIFPV